MGEPLLLVAVWMPATMPQTVAFSPTCLPASVVLRVLAYAVTARISIDKGVAHIFMFFLQTNGRTSSLRGVGGKFTRGARHKAKQIEVKFLSCRLDFIHSADVKAASLIFC